MGRCVGCLLGCFVDGQRGDEVADLDGLVLDLGERLGLSIGLKASAGDFY